MNEKVEATAAIEHAQSELDTALARLAKLPALDADRFAYATHALNNYLMVVTTILDVLRRRLGKMNDGEIGERLESLRHATTLMKQMVGHLVTSHGSEKPILIFTALDLAMAARAACDEYERPAAAKGLSLRQDIPSIAIMVWTDRIALGAVFDNVMSNAIKYSTRGGTIQVRVYARNDEGICAVSDAGPGISDADSERLFMRGAKLSSRPTAGEPSTGYGLAIAKDLVDALGGRIWFKNEALGGATFFIAVPLQRGDRNGSD